MMRAVVYRRYGGPEVLEIVQRPIPEPGEHEVLVRNYASSVTSGDWRVRSLHLPSGFGIFGRLAFGMFGPRQQVLGSEVAGRIERVGAKVTRFRVGDDVFAFFGAAMGAHAEYVTVREDGFIARKPRRLDFAQATALSFGGTTALGFLRRARVSVGESLLVVGASGGVGSAAVQIARDLGATVTAVTSARNAQLVRDLGARRVVDYTSEDFAGTDERFDVIFDTTGGVSSARVAHLLKTGGRVVLVQAGLRDILSAPLAARRYGHRVIVGAAMSTPADMEWLAERAERGALVPLIDQHFPLEHIADAHRVVDTGRKRGSVIVDMLPSS